MNRTRKERALHVRFGGDTTTVYMRLDLTLWNRLIARCIEMASGISVNWERKDLVFGFSAGEEQQVMKEIREMMRKEKSYEI